MSKMDVLGPNLNILFIGFNPSLTSFETGFNYAGRNNRFYQVLHQAGLTNRLYAPSESRLLLSDYGYGFTNIVARPTKTAAELTSDDYTSGRILLLEKLEHYRPKVACYIGKGVYEQFSKRRGKVPWGWQRDAVVEHVSDFVGPSTSGLVRMRLSEQVDIYHMMVSQISIPVLDSDSSGNGGRKSGI